MIKHFIIMSSSYTDGARIALDITDIDKYRVDDISEILQYIKKYCGEDVPLSTHFIETDSNTWDSVSAYDPFFEGVVCIKTKEEFTEKIKQNRVLTGLDIAIYILSKIKCTHLSLEKLVYFSYADYLCKHSKRLFVDKIYAFKHGPVIESVYERYKSSGTRYVNSFEFGIDKEAKTNVEMPAAKSRILFASDGIQKLCSIDETLKIYGSCKAGTLVSITHRKNSPWSHVDSTIPYAIISDDLIKNYHSYESL